MIHAFEAGTAEQTKELEKLLSSNEAEKLSKTLQIFRDSGVDKWAIDLKDKFLTEAFLHLDEIAVLSSRKQPLKELAHFLVQREH